jgi:hypothetical protein
LSKIRSHDDVCFKIRKRTLIAFLEKAHIKKILAIENEPEGILQILFSQWFF